MSGIVKLLPGLAAALIGVFTAYTWYEAPLAGIVSGLILGGLLLIGWVLHGAGLSMRRSNPVRSIRLLEGWALIYLAGGAVGVAFGIVLAVFLANQTPEGTSQETKQLITAAVTAVSTFVTSWLVKGLEDLDGMLAGRIKSQFATAYAGCYEAAANEGPSNAYLAAFVEEAPGASGWGWSARRARARVLAANPCPSN